MSNEELELMKLLGYEWVCPKRQLIEMEGQLFPLKWDSDAWLRLNGPYSLEDLSDLYYAVVHRSSHGAFRIECVDDREFEIVGHRSTLVIPTYASRRDLLLQLRKAMVREERRAWRTASRGS